MKREIKFRFYHEDYGVTKPINLEEFMRGEPVEIHFVDGTYLLIYEFDFPACIPMQYTGLKDANGIEIYEGDVLKYTNNDGHDTLQCVEFENGVYYLENGIILYLVNQVSEVVSNIYETQNGDGYEDNKLQ